MLDPHRLTILRAVIAAGSVHAAARNLHLAPATVSQHLRALARETDLVLFEKKGRGIMATPAAQHLAEASADTLNSLERLERTVEDLRQGRAEQIAIACFASLAQAWMPEVLIALRAQFPDAGVEVSINELQPGRGRRVPDVDVRIESLDGPPAYLEGYDRHFLFEEDFCVVLSVDHPLVAHPVVTMAELRDEPWIDHDIHDSPTGRIITRACHAAGFSPHYVARLDDYHAATSLAAAGLGITVLPRIALTGLPANLAVRPLSDPTVHRRIVAHTRTHLARARLIHTTLTALREAAQRIQRPTTDV
ncbi:LysR family transcriptional regulator [Kocuria nitroreducens]|uniref:LysR family transcriptional regulator n=1 Tax=Kocuria nitroreducens TaxID=3058914 RepID=UPI0036DA22B7